MYTLIHVWINFTWEAARHTEHIFPRGQYKRNASLSEGKSVIRNLPSPGMHQAALVKPSCDEKPALNFPSLASTNRRSNVSGSVRWQPSNGCDRRYTHCQTSNCGPCVLSLFPFSVRLCDVCANLCVRLHGHGTDGVRGGDWRGPGGCEARVGGEGVGFFKSRSFYNISESVCSLLVNKVTRFL